MLRLRLLTAQRGGEVLGATWAEMDLPTGWWTIPAERSKNGLAHRVPLSPQAVKVLKALHAITGDSLWVFPSPKKKDASITHTQKAIERVVERSGVDFRWPRFAANRGELDGRRRSATPRSLENPQPC